MKIPSAKHSVIIGGGVVLLALVYGYALLPNPVDAPSEESEIATTTTGSKPATTVKPSTGGGVVVTPQKVRIIAPNGGEVWQRGKQYPVKWTIAIDSRDVQVILIPSTSVIVNPFSVAPSRVVGQEMFNSIVFPSSSAEGSYEYKVPQTLSAGTYQVLIWAGEKCSTNQVKAGCAYDLSDRLLTIR